LPGEDPFFINSSETLPLKSRFRNKKLSGETVSLFLKRSAIMKNYEIRTGDKKVHSPFTNYCLNNVNKDDGGEIKKVVTFFCRLTFNT
jgi:hypothetical protein